MLFLKSWGLGARRAQVATAEPEASVDRRAASRCPVFKEAVLILGDFYRVRAIITDLDAHGAQIQYATRTELPFRIKISAPVCGLDAWARVVWQDDGVAGLEFLESDPV